MLGNVRNIVDYIKQNNTYGSIINFVMIGFTIVYILVGFWLLKKRFLKLASLMYSFEVSSRLCRSL